MSRELDALVAEKVLGWTKDAIDFRVRPPDYTTDPAADYEVLKHVREKWDVGTHDEFTAALGGIWTERRKRVRRTNFAMTYEPGDYSMAALKALGLDTPNPAAE